LGNDDKILHQGNQGKIQRCKLHSFMQAMLLNFDLMTLFDRNWPYFNETQQT